MTHLSVERRTKSNRAGFGGAFDAKRRRSLSLTAQVYRDTPFTLHDNIWGPIAKRWQSGAALTLGARRSTLTARITSCLQDIMTECSFQVLDERRISLFTINQQMDVRRRSMMFSQTVVLFFLCGFYAYCASAKRTVIEELERELNETKAAIDERKVTELEAQNANVSEEVLKETAKIKELYINLTNLEEKKMLLEREIAELQHWIEVRTLGIMFINQDIKLYRERIENGSAEKCFEFQEPVPLLLGRSDIDKDMVLMLQNELNQTRTTLNYLQSVQKELQMKLDQLTAYYRLKIDNLSELLERNTQDEEHAKETVKKFEMELKELS
ncbi:hypothetical protein J6590_091602 [Homalodisca vitripennis]|nr:hypothetical protein J6590_091602 [Homalodisca vitripennis]